MIHPSIQCPTRSTRTPRGGSACINYQAERVQIPARFFLLIPPQHPHRCPHPNNNPPRRRRRRRRRLPRRRRRHLPQSPVRIVVVASSFLPTHPLYLLTHHVPPPLERLRQTLALLSQNDPDTLWVQLASCHLSDSHVSLICTALEHNTNVLSMDLSSNDISDVGVEALSSCLMRGGGQDMVGIELDRRARAP